MILFPNCKINLGLHIIGKRADGYHNLQTVFYPLNLCDALEVIPHQTPNSPSACSFTSSGLTIAGDPENNLCVKAFHLLKQDFPQLPSLQLHVHKVIPMGAGLGGGSADGAFTLRLLNDQFALGLTTEQLLLYALQLGSDCPFFIYNKPCFATSRGEVLEPFEVDLSDHRIVVVHPGIHVSTAWAFAQLHPAPPEASLKEILLQPIATWKDQLINDFELAVLDQYPVIQEIKQELYKQGAMYASLSGSGSAVYGIFPKAQSISLHHFPPTFFVHCS